MHNIPILAQGIGCFETVVPEAAEAEEETETKQEEEHEFIVANMSMKAPTINPWFCFLFIFKYHANNSSSCFCSLSSHASTISSIETRKSMYASTVSMANAAQSLNGNLAASSMEPVSPGSKNSLLDRSASIAISNSSSESLGTVKQCPDWDQEQSKAEINLAVLSDKTEVECFNLLGLFMNETAFKWLKSDSFHDIPLVLDLLQMEGNFIFITSHIALGLREWS